MKFCVKGMVRRRVCSNHLAWMTVNDNWRTRAVRDELMNQLKLARKEGGPGQGPADIVHPYIAFNNPAVAIQFGLFDSLKHLVEDKGIDINSFEWTDYNSTKRMHLLYYAAVSSRSKKTFKYLLNRPDFNLRCKANEVDRGGSVFLKLLSLDHISSESGTFEHPFLRMFMQHPEFDVNWRVIPMNESLGFATPLLSAAVFFVRLLIVRFDEKKFQSTYHGAQILLSAGADPNLSFPGCVSPIEFLRHTEAEAQMGNLRDTSLKFFEANERHWGEAVALLEKYA